MQISFYKNSFMLRKNCLLLAFAAASLHRIFDFREIAVAKSINNEVLGQKF